LFYKQLKAKLDAAELTYREGTRFCSFKDDFIDDETWEYKDCLFFESGLGRLAKPIAHLVSCILSMPLLS
jgi:hypothetical protein